VPFIALHLVVVGAARAEGSPASPAQWAQAREPAGADGAKADADKPNGKADAKPDDKADDNAAAEAPGTRNLDLTPFQCEAVALGKPVKDLPADAQVEAVTFTDPPPVTLQLPTQSREAVSECNLRASGLTVRVDKTRKVITLLPSGTRSPELPNPMIKVTLKLSEGASKPEAR
jgi:hypothetical protein